MAQPLQTITVSAPAFKGLNTQDSPLSGDVQFASVVDNAVIDTFGRIGSRKGLQALTTDNTLLNGKSPTVIHEYEDVTGTLVVLSIANGRVFEGDTTLTDITPVGYVITDENFTIVNFNDKAWLCNKGHDMLVYDTTDGLRLASDLPLASTVIPQASIVMGAFGRLWLSGVPGSPNTVYWSDLLIGQNWDSGSSGSIDLDKVWPDGSDKVTALAVWNNYLVIFGYNSIVLYQNASSPANMSLADTISGVGCVARDTVKPTGSDLLFLSSRGLMTLGRTIQEKSNPINDVSKNIRDDLVRQWKTETQEIRAVYSPTNSFYLLYLPTNNIIYCFDTRGLLENGSFRVTRWVTTKHKSFCSTQNDDLLIGNSYGINKYVGHADNDESYIMRYYSNPLSFGDSNNIKFLKKISPTIIGGIGSTIKVKWSYDFTTDFKTAQYGIKNTLASRYNEKAEFGIDEYSTGGSFITAKRINTSGAGNLVTVGLETSVSTNAVSIQEFNIQATMGRVY
jgi:hypothetical protein